MGSIVSPSYQRIKVSNYRALQDVDLELRRLKVLIGPNGSGKSSLLDLPKLLAGLRHGTERLPPGRR
ncbi:MAG: AAA family ATPase [Candidatus Eremiobacterota bacterium]